VVPARIRPEVVHASDVAFVSGFNQIILIAAILSFVGAALGFALVRTKDFVQPTDGPTEPAG
jgi:small basic protein